MVQPNICQDFEQVLAGAKALSHVFVAHLRIAALIGEQAFLTVGLFSLTFAHLSHLPSILFHLHHLSDIEMWDLELMARIANI